MLNIGFQTFVGRAHLFNVLSDKKWASTGIEHWVQTELIVALIDRGYPVTTIGKLKKGGDLIVGDVKIEIKARTTPEAQWLIDAFKKNKDAHFYFFIYRTNDQLEEKLQLYINSKNLGVTRKKLDNNWILAVVGK